MISFISGKDICYFAQFYMFFFLAQFYMFAGTVLHVFLHRFLNFLKYLLLFLAQTYIFLRGIYFKELK